MCGCFWLFVFQMHEPVTLSIAYLGGVCVFLISRNSLNILPFNSYAWPWEWSPALWEQLFNVLHKKLKMFTSFNNITGGWLVTFTWLTLLCKLFEFQCLAKLLQKCQELSRSSSSGDVFLSVHCLCFKLMMYSTVYAWASAGLLWYSQTFFICPQHSNF